MEYLGNTKSINSLQPLVSVVVVTYNQEKYIEECLNSILNQKVNFDYEIIVGEDESKDSTRAICKNIAENHQDKIRLFLRQRKNVIYINNKATARYNLVEGIKSSRGKYIALLDGDDFWTNLNKLQLQVDFLEGNSNVSLCFHKIRTVSSSGEVLSEMKESSIKLYQNRNKLNRHIPTLSVCFKNQIVPLPKEIFQSPYGDLMLWAIIAELGDFADLGFLGGSYRKHLGGFFTKMSAIDQIKGTIIGRKLTLNVISKNNKLSVIKKILDDDYIGMKVSFKQFLAIEFLFFFKDFFFNFGNLLRVKFSKE